MYKVSPNPPHHKSRVEKLEEQRLEEAATRALDHYLKPKPGSAPEPDKSQLFMVAPHIDTETLLANASEDLLSISTLAADLADDVDDSRRCVALAISRMADGVQLLVERAMDLLEPREPPASSAKA